MKISAGSFALAFVLVGCGGGGTPAPVSPSNGAGASSGASTTATTAATESIRALSADEIRGLTEGRALRFGRAAEKNQNPTPYFLLKYRSELALFDEQMTPARAIMESERAQASKLGKEMLADEAKLEGLLATPGSNKFDTTPSAATTQTRTVATRSRTTVSARRGHRPLRSGQLVANGARYARKRRQMSHLKCLENGWIVRTPILSKDAKSTPGGLRPLWCRVDFGRVWLLRRQCLR